MLAPISGRRRDGKSSFRTLTRYLTESRDPVTGEIVVRGAHVLSVNLLSLETAVAEMRAVAFENPRVADPIYHCQLCWKPGERPSRAQWEEAARKTIRNLGFEKHQFLVVEHDDREHFHVHVLINRVHPETYLAHYPAFSKREEMTANRQRADAGRVAQKFEHFQDAGSLEANAKGEPVKALRDLLRQSGTEWQDVHVLLRKYGLEMEKADRGGHVVRAIDSVAQEYLVSVLIKPGD